MQVADSTSEASTVVADSTNKSMLVNSFYTQHHQNSVQQTWASTSSTSMYLTSSTSSKLCTSIDLYLISFTSDMGFTTRGSSWVVDDGAGCPLRLKPSSALSPSSAQNWAVFFAMCQIPASKHHQLIWLISLMSFISLLTRFYHHPRW